MRARELAPDAELVSDEVSALFRDGLARLARGEVAAAVDLLETSADREGGEGAAVARAQVVRMLAVRGHVVEAIALLDRSAIKDPDVVWRALADLLEPLVESGRSSDAVSWLIAAAESIPRARDFQSAFSGVVNVFQSVRVPDEVDQRVLSALRAASADRLDARLAVERLSGSRDLARGRLEVALLRLASLAADCLARGERELEARALTALCGLAARGGPLRADEREIDEEDHLLYEQPALEQAAHDLGPSARPVAAKLTAAARAAEAAEQPGAAAALERTAAVLLWRAGERRAAEAAAESAARLGALASELAWGEALTLQAWLDGAEPEPGSASPSGPAAELGEREETLRDLETVDDVDEEDDEAVDEADDDDHDDDDEGDEDRGQAACSTLVMPTRALTPVAFGQAPVRIGGLPRIPVGLRWPRCSTCGDGLTFVAELVGPEVALPAPFERALVFACNVAPWVDGYESRCAEGSDPQGEGALVVLERPTELGAERPPRRVPPVGTPVLRRQALAPSDAFGDTQAIEPLTSAQAEAAEPPTTTDADALPSEPLLDERGPRLGGEGPVGAPTCLRCGSPLLPVIRLGGAREPVVHIVSHGWLHVLACSAGCTDRGVAFWRPGTEQ